MICKMASLPVFLFLFTFSAAYYNFGLLIGVDGKYKRCTSFNTEFEDFFFLRTILLISGVVSSTDKHFDPKLYQLKSTHIQSFTTPIRAIV